MTRKVRSINVGLQTIASVLLLGAAASLAFGDPPVAKHETCPAATRQEARRLGDDLAKQGFYQRAGGCYEAAEEYGLANRAFLEAVEPESQAIARQVSVQRDQTKAMLRKLQQAWGPKH
jgi:hypothetical protein